MGKISSIFAVEAKRHLLAFSFAALLSEVCRLYYSTSALASDSRFPILVTFIFLSCCILEHLFELVVSGIVSRLFSVIPPLAILLVIWRVDFFLLLQGAIIFGVVLRLFIGVIPERRRFFVTLPLLLDIIVLVLCFNNESFHSDILLEKLLCISLVILTLSALESVFCAKGSPSFPIHFFLCLGIFSMLIPMGSDPIDWSPVVRAGERIAAGIETAADNATYYFSIAFGDSYNAGYSSLSATGGKLNDSDRLQLLLETESLPYHTYTNEETGKTENMRRTLYLAGGKGADTLQFVRFLKFLYEKGADRDMVLLFSEVSDLDLEYVYLDTHDEIAPSTAFELTLWGEKVTKGSSGSLHRKGYRVHARYLDLDYGSPYLTELLRSSANSAQSTENFSYQTAASYASDLWDIDLGEVISESEFEKALAELPHQDESIRKEYLVTSGAGSELKSLSDELTAEAESEYDKCRFIESFLRRYTYSTDAVGGYDNKSDMSTSQGISDIATRFLFDTGSGYCVHYTSSMVMLLRLAGIPARAVTGYRYAFPFEKADEYKVNNSCAHAWPEAYIEGAGWIPFEPTAAYYTPTENSWHRKAVSKEPTLPSSVTTAALPSDAGTDPAEDSTPESDTGNSFLIALKVLWPFVLSAILLALLLIGGTKLYLYLRYRLASPTQQLLMDVDLIKKNLVRLSKKNISDRGLLSDFEVLAPSELSGDVTSVFSTANRLLYAGNTANTPTTEESARAKSLRQKLQKQQGRRSKGIHLSNSSPA
jgi:transglutaminase-like putative cysteine protease